MLSFLRAMTWGLLGDADEGVQVGRGSIGPSRRGLGISELFSLESWCQKERAEKNMLMSRTLPVEPV